CILNGRGTPRPYNPPTVRCEKTKGRVIPPLPGPPPRGAREKGEQDSMTSTPGGLSESVTNETAETGVAIDRSSFVPLYYQLALILWERLASGRLRPGDKLPSESELSTEFGISRSVIRPALTILESEGRIIRIKGRGCFIAQPKVPLAVRGLVPRIAAGIDPDLKISILDARTVRCTAETGRQLGLRAGQPVLHVVSSASSE